MLRLYKTKTPMNIFKKDNLFSEHSLAAQSFVSYSFEDELSTLQSNISGVHYMLSAVHDLMPTAKFYFAHRLSTIVKADNIIVLKNFSIVEEGNHLNRLERKGEYWKLYNKLLHLILFYYVVY